MKFRIGAIACAIAMLTSGSALAADHGDGTMLTDASTDINDLYSWVDGTKLNLIMTVFPFADATAAFSDSAVYSFHVGSSPTPLSAAPETNIDIRCTFDTAQAIQCFVGDSAGATAAYVTGDASPAAGITSEAGDVTVFAGRVRDPFYFYLGGFNTTRATVLANAAGLTFDGAGCPLLDAATGQLLRDQLTGADSGPAVNTFESLTVLAISMQVDLSLLNAGGAHLGVWASTNAGN